MADYSLSDIKAMIGGESFGGGGMILLVIIILFLFFVMMRGGNGGQSDYATQADINAAIAAQNQQQILLSSANNNFEVAKMISDQNLAMMGQQNANNINLLQGYNALAAQMMNQTNMIANKLDGLGFALEQCCCRIQTLIKDNQIADLTSQLSNANNIAVNAAQTQTILGTMGKWYANPAATAA